MLALEEGVSWMWIKVLINRSIPHLEVIILNEPKSQNSNFVRNCHSKLVRVLHLKL